MKKLAKLSINPERVMKNEELVNLRGGDGYYCNCICTVNGEQINKPYIANLPNDCMVFCGGYFYTYPAGTETYAKCQVLPC